MFTSSAIILTANLQSDLTSSLTHAVLSPVRVADGHPLRCSNSRRILPSENIFCQRKACAFDIASSPKACWSFPRVVVALSPSLTQKGNMAYRCAMFRASFSWRGSQTPPDMSSTYSTLKHCTAMPLHVRIEEGRRSKPVCFSRLQYCQYSQEKISLITSLWYHVRVYWATYQLRTNLECFISWPWDDVPHWLMLYDIIWLNVLLSIPYIVTRL